MAAGKDSVSDPAEQWDAASDESLARRVQRGERDALEQLVRRYLRPIHAVAASYLPEPADVEDAAQETFLRALRAIGSYDPRRPFAPWLYQIARNVARSHLSAGARWPAERLSEGLQSATPRPDTALEGSEMRGRVDAAIARLPEQRRTAFYLVEVEGYETAEAARVMGLSPGTVRSHLHHARSALRAALGGNREQLEIRGG